MLRIYYFFKKIGHFQEMIGNQLIILKTIKSKKNLKNLSCLSFMNCNT